jgi:putative peptidoglycan lipid II flippase
MQILVKRLLFGGLAGKILGVLREVIAAWCFGTGLVASAYRLAQAAFLLPLHGFVSDVVSGAFTPQYARLRVSDPEAAERLFAAMQRVLLIAAISVAAALMIWGEYLVTLMAPGFSPSARQLSVQFVFMLAPALPAYVLIGLYGATELVHGESRILAARASIQSLGLMIGTLAAWWLNRPLLIAGGFVVSYFGLLLWAIVINRSLGLRFHVAAGGWGAWLAALKPVAKVFFVLMWVPLALQVSQIFERRTASLLDTNAVAAVDYARFITDTALILLAMPFGTAGQASMPTMTRQDFEATALRSIKVLLIIGIPISAFVWASAGWIVSNILGRGAFNSHSVDVTSTILSAQALGLFLMLVAYVAQKFLNARGKNKLVLVTSVGGAAVSVAINVGFANMLGISVLGYAAVASGGFIAVAGCASLGLLERIAKFAAPFLACLAVHVASIAACRAVVLRSNVWAEIFLGVLVWVVFFALNRDYLKILADMLNLRPRGVV